MKGRNKSSDENGLAFTSSTMWLLLLAMLSLAALPGCGGCRREAKTDEEIAAEEAEKKKKDQEKPKPDFEEPRLFVQPNEALTAEEAKSSNRAASAIRAVKAAHWTSATQEMKANNFDFVGELEASVVNTQGAPLELARTPFRLKASRPAALPKGTAKHLELTFFVPDVESRPWLATRLEGLGSSGEPKQEPLELMPAHQYYFVVLAGTPDRYRYLDKLASIAPPNAEGHAPYYRVLRPQIEGRAPVPSHSLTWTNTAYVIWDDLNPDLLSREQQEAMLDWIHWGGQLLISGPDSLDALRGSFLRDYLPVAIEQTPATLKLTADDIKPLSDQWTVPETKSPLAVLRTWPGIALVLHPQGRSIPGTGNLLAERFVGRGRIVISAFPLSQGDLLRWPSFDGFFNAVLLRRPRRAYSRSEQFGTVQVTWADDPSATFDPRLSCGLRYLSRDVDRSQTVRSRTVQDAAALQGYTVFEGGVEAYDEGPGVGGWDDFNGVSQAARESLRDAAGIEIPEASFVVTILTAYLIVLVPLNWGLFKFLGRVEWAWVAAPLIAVVCAVFVIKLAQLDIGFARSQREIALVELQAGYPRAHVTRYTALYTSLSTSYDLHFSDHGAVAQPFPADVNYQVLSGQTRSTVTHRRAQDTSLGGFEVSSNSTAMVHSEEMFDMGGSISLSEQSINNGTRLTLLGAGVVRRTSRGQLQAAWLGSLSPGESKPLAFAPARAGSYVLQQWNQLPKSDSSDEPDAASLGRLLRLMQDGKYFQAGDVRLIGWTEEQLPGVTIQPAASQVRYGTLLVANLRFASKAAPQRDANVQPPDTTLELPELDLKLE